jgi:hypothetical protein
VGINAYEAACVHIVHFCIVRSQKASHRSFTSYVFCERTIPMLPFHLVAALTNQTLTDVAVIVSDKAISSCMPPAVMVHDATGPHTTLIAWSPSSHATHSDASLAQVHGTRT